jgi:hypothetical protein
MGSIRSRRPLVAESLGAVESLAALGEQDPHVGPDGHATREWPLRAVRLAHVRAGTERPGPQTSGPQTKSRGGRP